MDFSSVTEGMLELSDVAAIDVLPDDILLHIFRCLTPEIVLKQLQFVSKRWKDVALQFCKSINIFNQSLFPHATGSWEKFLSIIKKCPNIHSMDIGHSMDTVERQPDGVILWHYFDINTKQLVTIKRWCPNITNLGLASRVPSCGSLWKLGQFNQLTKLDLSVDPVFQHCTLHNSSKEFALRSAFSSMSQLSHLTLTYNRSLSGECLLGINRSKLEYLNIWGCHFTDKGCDALTDYPWPALKKFIAVNFQAQNNFSLLSKLADKVPNLVHLDQTGSESDGMTTLASLEKLSELHISGQRSNAEHFSNELEALSSANSLCRDTIETLDLGIVKWLPSTCFFHIGKFRNLRQLTLVGTGLDGGVNEPDKLHEDTVWTIASGCTSLEKVTFRGFDDINDTCLGVIGSYCALLTHFDCIACFRVSNEGIKALVSGLRTSQHRPANLPISIFARCCAGVNLLSLEINALWVSVDCIKMPDLHPALPDEYVSCGVPIPYAGPEHSEVEMENDLDDDSDDSSLGLFGDPMGPVFEEWQEEEDYNGEY